MRFQLRLLINFVWFFIKLRFDRQPAE